MDIENEVHESTVDAPELQVDRTEGGDHADVQAVEKKEDELPPPATSTLSRQRSVYDIPIVENAFSWAVVTAAMLINMLAISIVYSWGECKTMRCHMSSITSSPTTQASSFP